MQNLDFNEQTITFERWNSYFHEYFKIQVFLKCDKTHKSVDLEIAIICYCWYCRCPVYYNLPSLCTLVKKPGDCCLQPVCNFPSNVQKFESTGAGMTANGISTYCLLSPT